jgi:hypothetical protein
MTDFEPDNGTTRDDLLQRVALMETMIAEGRKSTARFGWIFVMWGLIYFVAMGWVVLLPFKDWAWPVCVTIGILIGIFRTRQMRATGATGNERSRSIGAVWQAMCIAIILYVTAAGVSGHGEQPAYYAAVFFFVGLAHGISAGILRWGVQGLVALIWWGCGIALFFFNTRNEVLFIFLAAAFFGMILFGLYAMWLERKSAGVPRQNQVQHHA